jgi:hypothetical protein
MNPAAWRLYAAVGTALAAVGILLALPTPATPTPATSTGPLTLAQAWPGSHTIDLAATLPDGSTFAPAAALDARTAVVRITSADTNTTSLALLSTADPTHPRVLQQMAVGDGASFDGVTVAGTDVYWTTSVPDGTGGTHSTLYRADTTTGIPARITDDTGQTTFSASQFDLQVAAGRVYWNAVHASSPYTNEIRSVPVAGGPVAVRPLDDASRLTAWPWVVSTFVADQPTTELNLTTGARRTIAPKPGEELYCGPVWCRGVMSGPQTSVITDRHADGSGTETRINRDGEGMAFVDVAILDRFEPLAAPISNQATTASERFAMYDLKTHQHIALAVSTAEGTAGGWLWWSTGDNETLTWHLLDLTTLH